MRLLLLREAGLAMAAAVTLVFVPTAYLWRSLPPWVVRDALWRLDGPAFALAGAAALAGYLLLTGPAVRILLGSARLSYWRQFPIPRAQWGRLHGEHLFLANLPGAAAAAYLLRPLDNPAAVAGATAATMLVAVAAQWFVGRARLPAFRRIRWPRPRRPVAAMLRLYATAVLHRDRSAASLVVATQVGVVGLAAIGVRNVFMDETVSTLLDGAAVLGGLVAGWVVLRGQRAVDRDRWYLDAQGGARPATELAARLAVGVLFGLPTVIGVIAAALPTGLLPSLRAAGGALVALGWGVAAFTRIGARAEARRELAEPHTVAVAVAALYGALLFLRVGVGALVLAAAAEVLAARRFLAAAAIVRARFETTAKGDDHE